MGRRKSRLPSRTPKEWGIRAAIGAIALVLAYFAVTHSLAQVLRTKAPERAYAMAPYDGRITAYFSGEMSGPEATTEQRAKSDKLALLALQQDATAVAAVATLGLNAHIRGELASARRYFAYSNKISRRDLRTRLWLIEDAVAREDVAGALRNYDIALRTSRAAPDLLYPVLASAINDVSIRTELVKVFANEPKWGVHFLNYLATQGDDPAAVAQLYIELDRAGLAISDFAKSGIINKLIDEENYLIAWTYYSETRNIKERDRVRDPNFKSTLANPSQFDWMPMGSEAGISTVIRGEASGGGFDFSAPSSVGGPLLQQLQMLLPGTYLLEGRSIGIDQDIRSLPYWSLTCIDGRELGRVVVANSRESSRGFSGRFIVPADCPTQRLRFVAQSSSAIGGQSGKIEEVRIGTVP